MADYQTDVLDHLGFVIGGTASTASTAGNTVTRFWSGHLNGDDGTGLLAPSGEPKFQGCYSVPPGGISFTPVGIILPPSSFTAVLNMQGPEENTDNIRLLILLAPADSVAQWPNVSAYRDIVPAQIRAHMTLKDSGGNAVPNILQAFVRGGKSGKIGWGTESYYGWDFDIQVRRLPIATYIP